MGNTPIELKEVPQPKADEIVPGAKFPMHVHSEDGKSFRVVKTEDELSQAVADGWVRVDVDPTVNEPAPIEDAPAPAAPAAPKAAAKKGKK